MNKQGKEQVVAEVRATLSEAAISISTHYRGLTVAEMTELRRKIFETGAEYRVVKNTLAKLAAKGTPHEPLSEFLTGPTALATSRDPVGPSKALTEYAKGHPNLIINGAVMDGKLLNAADVAALAKLPPKEVLAAQLMGVMMGPLRGFVTVLHQVPSGLVRVLDQVRQQKEEAA